MKNTDKKIAIIGQENVISCFKFVGFETFFVSDQNECIKAFDRIKNDASNYAMIFITENYYQYIQSDPIIKKNKLLIPITIIPDNTGSKNIALNSLSNIVEQATGSNILK